MLQSTIYSWISYPNSNDLDDFLSVSHRFPIVLHWFSHGKSGNSPLIFPWDDEVGAAGVIDDVALELMRFLDPESPTGLLHGYPVALANVGMSGRCGGWQAEVRKKIDAENDGIEWEVILYWLVVSNICYFPYYMG